MYWPSDKKRTIHMGHRFRPNFDFLIYQMMKQTTCLDVFIQYVKVQALLSVGK